MNTRLFSAYSQDSKRPLATRITVIDSVIEPIKVLKILLEGITPTDETGIWITRFSGLPVARSFSPFDLVYLDDDFRVVHTVEITQKSNFVPFKGLPTSALVLPPDSIVLSKTHAGDRLAIYAYDPAVSSDPASAGYFPRQASRESSGSNRSCIPGTACKPDPRKSAGRTSRGHHFTGRSPQARETPADSANHFPISSSSRGSSDSERAQAFRAA